jgi:hypothetical protein
MPKRISAKELGGNPSGGFLIQLADIHERCGAIKAETSGVGAKRANRA